MGSDCEVMGLDHEVVGSNRGGVLGFDRGVVVRIVKVVGHN